MIDFTDAPKLKKGYGGANGNKISILLNKSMLPDSSIFCVKTLYNLYIVYA